MGYVSEQLRINIKKYFKMECEEERAGGGQAYDYLFAAHQSIAGQNKDVCFWPVGFQPFGKLEGGRSFCM